MTVRTFYKKLSEVKDKFEWKILKDGCIRGYIKGKSAKKVRCFCPITAVCYDLTGKAYRPFHYELAAERIGLIKNNYIEADTIVDAADSKNCTNFVLNSRRRTLLRRLGL